MHYEDDFDAKEAPRRLLQIGAPAPDFEAETTQGYIRLSTWRRDSWVVLFSHPADFTPVCTTEFIAFARMAEDFEERGVALLGLSVDSVYSHIAWVRDIESTLEVKVPFPIIADVEQRVARLYNMVHRPSSLVTTIRSLFIIDPQRRLRSILHYPSEAGRNVEEILRLVDALQAVDRSGGMAPEGWRRGQRLLRDAPTTDVDAARTCARPEYARTWYLAELDDEGGGEGEA